MIVTDTYNPSTKDRQESFFARYGNRYYPVDESYDKRLYENDLTNWAKIVGCLLTFWICNSLHWWGVFSLGIVATDALIYYSAVCFVFTLSFLAGLLVSGKYANQLKRKHEFYVEKLAEKRYEETTANQKKEQARLHQQKLEEQEAKMRALALKEAAEAAAANDGPAPAVTSQGVPTNIQDDQPQRDPRLLDTRA